LPCHPSPSFPAGLKAEQIDILVTNCSIYCPTPSLASLIINMYKMREDIQSYNLGGMGCAMGVVGLSLVRDLLKVREGRRRGGGRERKQGEGGSSRGRGKEGAGREEGRRREEEGQWGVVGIVDGRKAKGQNAEPAAGSRKVIQGQQRKSSMVVQQ
jgi:hypothetical protein